MDFIETYMEYVKPLKGSPRYHLWSIIAVLSATLERRCYGYLWGKKIFPNLYITLAGPAGSGKTFSSGAAVQFIHEINQNEERHGQKGVVFMPDKCTPAAVIRKFEQSEKDLNGYKYRSLFSYADELSSFILDIGGGSLANDLLKYYDAPTKFEKEIIGKDKPIKINNISVSTLWDTTPGFLQRYLPAEISKEGIGSRIIFVPEYRHPRFDRVPKQPDDGEMKNKLLERLYEVYAMQGEFGEEEEATKELDRQHELIQDALANLTAESNFKQYMSRKNVHLWTLAMVSAVSRGTMQIEKCDADRAVSWLEDIEMDLGKIFGLRDISKDQDAAMALLDFVPQEGIYEDELLRMMLRRGSIFPQDSRWDACIKFLTSAGLLSVTTPGVGKPLYKRLRDANMRSL